MLTHRLMAVAFGGLLCVAACSSGTGLKNSDFAGEWETSGSISAFFLSVSQTGRDISGELSGPASTGVAGSISGTVTGSTVSFLVSFGWRFSGRFENNDTVVGTMTVNGTGEPVTLTRQ